MSEATSIDSDEVLADLSRLLDRVERGEAIVIARNGVPVAKLIPASADVPLLVVEAMLTDRDAHGPNLGGLSVRELIDEGRLR